MSALTAQQVPKYKPLWGYRQQWLFRLGISKKNLHFHEKKREKYLQMSGKFCNFAVSKEGMEMLQECSRKIVRVHANK